MKNAMRWKAAALALAAMGTFGAITEAFAQNEIFVPALVYRTGPYAPNGVPWADGFVDYLKLVNERDGGINGVKIAYEECETGYATDRGVECYERLKSRKPVAFVSWAMQAVPGAWSSYARWPSNSTWHPSATPCTSRIPGSSRT